MQLLRRPAPKCLPQRPTGPRPSAIPASAVGRGEGYSVPVVGSSRPSAIPASAVGHLAMRLHEPDRVASPSGATSSLNRGFAGDVGPRGGGERGSHAGLPREVVPDGGLGRREQARFSASGGAGGDGRPTIRDWSDQSPSHLTQVLVSEMVATILERPCGVERSQFLSGPGPRLVGRAPAFTVVPGWGWVGFTGRGGLRLNQETDVWTCPPASCMTIVCSSEVEPVVAVRLHPRGGS